MARYEITAPDGSRYEVTAPDNASEAQVLAYAQRQWKPASPEQSKPQRPALQQFLGDAVAGAIRGAGSIGATLMAPFDVAEQGIEKLLGAPKRDTSINAQRRADMDAALGNLGADTNSLAYGGGKLGAEVAGTLGVGGVLAKPLAVVAPRLAAALQSGGFTLGAPASASFAGRLGDMGLRMAGGAGTGAASAGLVNPEDADTGAMIGAALPPALRVAAAGGRLVGRGLQNAAAVVSDRAANSIAARQAANAIEPGLSTAALTAQRDIPLSAAAALDSAGLARLEQASRLRMPGAWDDFTQRQAGSVWDAVRNATGEADQLALLRQQRGENWRDAWDAATRGLNPSAAATPSQIAAAKAWPSDVAKFREYLDKQLQSAASANPAVRSMLAEISGTVDRLGDNFSPAALQQIRANLSGKSWAMAQDPLKAVPRDAPATINMLSKVDDMLNKVTNGQWQKVVAGYAQDSAGVDAARAAGKVRGSFVEPDTGRLLKTAADAAGDIPKVTEAGLRGAMNRGPGLSANAQGGLGDVMDAIRAQDIVQRVKRASTAGGDSGTISNALALGESRLPGWVGGLLSAGRSVARGKTDAAMAGLLSDPQALAAALARSRASGLLDDPTLLMTLYRAGPVLAADR